MVNVIWERTISEAGETGKGEKQPQDDQSSRVPTAVGEIFSADVMDLKAIIGNDGEKFVSVIVDHYSGYTYTRSLPSKESELIRKLYRSQIVFSMLCCSLIQRWASS